MKTILIHVFVAGRIPQGASERKWDLELKRTIGQEAANKM